MVWGTGVRRGRPLLVGSALLAVAACGESQLAKLSDTELQEGMHECNTTLDQAPGMAIRCDNYRRECQRRREQGRFVC